MLIKTKYIDCASKSVFNTWKLPTSAADTSGDIYWSAVVYIKDTGEVWTHGKLYGGFFSNADNNKVSLTIGGTTKILALDGHAQSYTTLTGSGSTADQAILSTGEANKWTLKTLGKNAFSNVDYLPADATAVAAEKVVHALAFQYNGKAIHSFDGSVARVLNIIQGDNVFITGDSQGNVTIAADPGSDTVNTAGATNKVDTKLFLIGAESQTTAPQTYSNQYVYIGTDNCLYSLGKKVLTEHQAIYNLDLQTQVGEAVTKVTTFDPNAANNSFTLVQGTNVTLTPDAANKKVTISSKDTTYDFYNLVFKQGESVIDTYKPTTSPSKTLKAGTNVTFTGSNNEVLITTQDTRNTAGATEKLTTKLFLTGALTQTDNPQTYTNSKVYIGADNKLYSDGKVVSTGDHTHNYAGATSPGGPALKVDLNPSGLLDATYGSYGGILQGPNKGPVSGSWSNRIKILHNNSTGYYTELAQNFTGTAGLWHRRNVAGTISEWTPVIDNANFHTYLDSTYVIRGNDPNVLTNYVRYSINTGLTMNWEWGNATPTHIWGAKASDSSKAYVFNGDDIRAFANAVNRAGDIMTGPLVIASTVNNQYNEGLRISLAANNWAGITFGSTGTSGAPSNGWFAARNPSNQFIISPGDSSSSTGLTLNKGGNLLWRNRDVLLKDEINSQVGGSKYAQMNWASWGADNYGGAIQIRERELVTNTQSAWSYSPALSFHWAYRYVKRFGMRSDGLLAVDDVPISLSTHTHNYVKDISNGTNTTFAYSKAGMNYADFTWLAGWNGYELRAVNKSLFAQASHTHDYIPRVWWHWSGQSGQPTWLWGGNSENNYYIYNPSNFNVNSATYAHKVRGEYTGGQQNPNYFGTNWVGFRMMNTTVGTDSQYKDWIISDCYSGNDVGGAVAFGMNRQSLGAYLMGSDSNRSSWTRKGTFWGDWNLDPVTKSQLKKTRVPGEVVDFYVYQVNGYTCTSTDYTTFRNQLFDSSGRGKSSVLYKATSSSMTYTVNLSDFVLARNEISTYSNGMYTAGGGEIESNRIGSTAGANSKTITGYEMPKHAHWFGRYRSDNANDRDVFGPDGGQNHSTNGTTSAGQGGNWRTGYSGNGQSKDWRPKTIFVFKMVYAPQSW